MLDFKRMRVLREVSRQGSFSAAAAALSYTQPAVSQQIAALEREAGTRLVERNARGVRLTEAGEALVGHAEAILARLAAAEAELEAIAGLRGGRMRLASFATAGATIMPLAIATFRDRHPSVELSLVEAEPETSIPALRTGELELALTFQPNALADDEGIEHEHLLDDPMYAALPAAHRLAGRARIRLEDLASEPWIQPTASCPCSRLVTDACGARGFQPHVAFESDDYLAVQGLVAAGVGVSLIPDLALSSVREDIVIRPLSPRPVVRRVMVATQPGALRSAATVAMVDILREVAEGYPLHRPALAAA
jgi:DNA-binding transcriptional LysR family regulator